MNQQTVTTDVEVKAIQINLEDAARMALEAVHSEVWEELLDEEPERWDGMS